MDGLFTLLGAIMGAVISGFAGFLQQKFVDNKTVNRNIWEQKCNLLKQIANSLYSITQVNPDRLNNKDVTNLNTAMNNFSDFCCTRQGEFYVLCEAEYRNEIFSLYEFINEKLECGDFNEHSQQITERASILLDKTKDEILKGKF